MSRINFGIFFGITKNEASSLILPGIHLVDDLRQTETVVVSGIHYTLEHGEVGGATGHRLILLSTFTHRAES